MTVLIKKQLKKANILENELKANKKQLETTSEKLKEKEVILSKHSSIDKTELLSIFKLLENTLSTEDEWEEFKSKFKELNPNFYKNLSSKYTNLTKSERRLFTLIKIGYSQKEIASILNIAPDSVKKARSRARKKLNLSSETSLTEFLKTL